MAATHLQTTERSALTAADLAKLSSHLAEIREIVARLDPAVRDALHDMLQEGAAGAAQAPEPSPTGRRGTFGLFAGQFSIGPDFGEPLPEEELRAWGEL